MSFKDKPPLKKPKFLVLDLFLREHYPNIFTKYMPMKIGIYEDILKENPTIDQRLLKTYLALHANNLSYLKILTEHDFRYDLHGVSVCQMTSEEKAFHAKKYQDCCEKSKKLKIKEASNAS